MAGRREGRERKELDQTEERMDGGIGKYERKGKKKQQARARARVRQGAPITTNQAVHPQG